jgi:hypothetical protein
MGLPWVRRLEGRFLVVVAGLCGNSRVGIAVVDNDEQFTT